MKLSCSGSRYISSADVCRCLQIAVANNLGVAGRRHAQISVAAIKNSPAFRVMFQDVSYSHQQLSFIGILNEDYIPATVITALVYN